MKAEKIKEIEGEIKAIENRMIEVFIEEFMDWTKSKLKEVSEELWAAADEDPSSWSCGYNKGYQTALVDFRDKFDKSEQKEYIMQKIKKGIIEQDLDCIEIEDEELDKDFAVIDEVMRRVHGCL